MQALDLLDGPLRAAAPLERLEGLATSIGSTLRASAAAVSLCPHGAGVIETLFTLDLRSGHSSSVRFGVDGERYELGVYPRTPTCSPTAARSTSTRATPTPTPPSARCSKTGG